MGEAMHLQLWLDLEDSDPEKSLHRIFCHYKSQQTLDDVKVSLEAQHWWLTLVIIATQEAEIRRVIAQSQPQSNSSWDLMLKNQSQGQVECLKWQKFLPSNPEALSSKSSATKKHWIESEYYFGELDILTILTFSPTNTIYLSLYSRQQITSIISWF
jgi:hypothetical protein